MICVVSFCWPTPREETLEGIADRFLVSVAGGRRFLHNGTARPAERVPHQPRRSGGLTPKCAASSDGLAASKPDLTLAQLRPSCTAKLAFRSAWPHLHLLKKLGLRLKKSPLHRSSETPKPNRERRKTVCGAHPFDPPERLIFLDESGVTTSMTRLYARRWEQTRQEATPGGHWKIDDDSGCHKPERHNRNDDD